MIDIVHPIERRVGEMVNVCPWSAAAAAASICKQSVATIERRDGESKNWSLTGVVSRAVTQGTCD